MSKEVQINRRLGKVIARRRAIADYTQEQVAEQLGIGKEAFSRIERGVSGASVAKLYELADLFKCGVEAFLVEGSQRPTEQAERIAQMLEGLSIADRQFVVEIVERMALKFRASSHRRPRLSEDR